MENNLLVDVFSIILQMLATILIALEYYLDKKKLHHLAKVFKQNIKTSKKNRDDEVTYKLNQHKKYKKRYMVKLISSMFMLFIFFTVVYYVLQETLVEDIVIYLIIGTLVLVFSTIIIVLSLLKLLDPFIANVVTLTLYEFPQKSILLAKKSIFVGLGVFMLLLSFVLNLAGIIGIGIEIVKLITIFTILIVIFYLSLLAKSYKNVN